VNTKYVNLYILHRILKLLTLKYKTSSHNALCCRMVTTECHRRAGGWWCY